MQYYEMMVDGGKRRENDIIARPCVEVKDKNVLYEGVFINDWDNDMTFEYDPKEGYIVPEYLCNVYGWSIFSGKSIKLFGDLISSDVQLLPIKIVNKNTGQETDKYFVINVLPFLDALDLKNSIYDYLGTGGKKRLSVIKYGIKKEKVGKHHIFRLKESQFALFVSEEFYKVVKKNKMAGCDFLKVKTS
ncbi:MAG: hypothetical protein LBC70_08750 [Chitinispirillales bacterium]|jgi:hypothetical protein|nr:hypothetical protein [Chitinispirillales bacterium]